MLGKQFLNRAAAAALLLLIMMPASMFSYGGYKGKSYKQYKHNYPSQEKIDRQVDSVFRKLSTREKIAQIMIIEFSSEEKGKKLATQKRLIQKEKIGGLIPMNDVLIPAMKRMNQLNRWAKIPMIVAIDAEWGASMRWKEIPAFPRFMQLGALSSDSLVYEMGRQIGMECRELKMHVNFSPDIDINNNPNNPAINTRSFGEDKEKVAQYGIAMMRGMRDGGIAGSAKHFPGHGDTDVDSHLGLPVLPFTKERLDSLEMYPFRKLVVDGVEMVMVAHLSIPALDPSGTPSSISKPIVTGLLREKMGYDGIICTDALNMDGVAKESGLEKKDIPLAAYKAGADLLLMPEDVENSITVIEKALKRGEITMEGLNMRVKKMLALKARLGVFDKNYDPYVDIDALTDFTDQEIIRTETTLMELKLDLIKRIAKESMTLLYNDNSAGYGIPVSFEGKKVAYVGYKNPQLGHEFGAIAKRYGQVDTILLGNDASIAALREAKNRLKEHDLVIMGFNQTDQRPHKNYAINVEDVNFITDWAKEQPMIAVYLGSPYALTRIPGHKNFTALLLGYINTQVNNFAAAQAVFGGIPIKGVLPVTAASFKVGEGIHIPDRYREEYPDFVGSSMDKMLFNPKPMNFKELSAEFTVLPQIAEMIAGGKIKLSDTVGQLLEADDRNASMTVDQLLKGFKNDVNAYYIQAIIEKYRRYVTIEEAAQFMFVQMGMQSAKFAGGRVLTSGYSVPEVIMDVYDLTKFHFTVRNGGSYAGKQVFSAQAAEIIKKYTIGL